MDSKLQEVRKVDSAVDSVSISVRSRIAFFEENSSRFSDRSKENCAKEPSNLKRKRESDDGMGYFSPSVSVMSVVRKLASPGHSSAANTPQVPFVESCPGLVKERIEMLCQGNLTESTCPEKRIKLSDTPTNISCPSHENSPESGVLLIDREDVSNREAQSPANLCRTYDTKDRKEESPLSNPVSELCSFSALSDPTLPSVPATSPDLKGNISTSVCISGFHLTRSQIPSTRSGKKRVNRDMD